MAKGEISIKTFKSIYLIEYKNIKLRKPIDTTVFIMPSIEKTFAEFPSTFIIASEILTNLEKHISVCKYFPPTSLIAVETSEFKFITCVQRKKLAFINIPTKISFNIN